MFKKKESTIYTLDGYLRFKLLAVVMLLIETIISIVETVLVDSTVVIVLNSVKVVLFLAFSLLMYRKESINPPIDKDTDADINQDNVSKSGSFIFIRRVLSYLIWLGVTVVVCVVLVVLNAVGDATGSNGINFALIPGIALIYRRFAKWLVKQV